MHLNPQQLEAVTHGEGPLLVLAGAGSGKTRVLTSRIAHLIAEKRLNPESILAVTFTNKAASEMKTRVEALTGVPPEMLWVSTFHSFCLRVLRKYSAHLGYRRGFVIFDEGDQLSLIKSCLKALNISDEKIPPSSAVNRISRAKDGYVTAELFADSSDNFWDKQFAPVYEMYQAELVKQNAMDFGDLIVNIIKLFEREPQTLAFFQNHFRHVLVDEYQDTNLVQYRLIRSLGEAHKNVFVVGDEDQSIYRWRGADIKNILEFKNDFPGAKIIRLEQNYRSTPTILSAANSVIRQNKKRLGKNLWTELPDMERVTVVQKLDGLEEAKYVAGEIDKYVRKGLRYDNTAIFYRTNAQSRAFEECFRNRGIPYVIYGGMKFYERMEIKDILAYLKFILDDANDTALMRIINVPVRGIGKSTIEDIRIHAREKGSSMAAAIDEMLEGDDLSPRAKKSLIAFRRMIGDIRSKLDTLSLGDLTGLLLESSGYMSFHKNSPAFDASDRLENIQEFLRATYEFTEPAKSSLPRFLDQVALVSDVDNLDDQKGAVPMMTVHLSKGLEFPAVFMVGMEEGLFPHIRSTENEDELEEERRLCYVGMTRAKEKLHMIHCCSRKIYGRDQYSLPSRFLDEIDDKYVERERLDTVGAASVLRSEHTFYSSSEALAESRSNLGSRRSLPRAKSRGSNNNMEGEPAHDFDQRPEDEKESCLKVGTRVRHPVFGDGTVLKTDGSMENQKVMIRFKNGQLKTIVVKYAQLQII